MRSGFASHRAAVLGIAAAALTAAALRVPFIWAGIGPDEGGYAYVAREWARGAALYKDVWIDRPQGLILLYRALVDISATPAMIRIGAVLAGVVLTLLLAALAWRLASPRAGVAAATMFAVVGVGPHIEGFTMNGELAAAVPATGAILAAVIWHGTRRRPWLVAAGALGAAGILMKQSGIDGLVAVSVFALVVGAGALARVKQLALVAAGAAIPLAAAALHGLSVGWSTYWTDVVGYRATQDLQGKGPSRSEFFSISVNHWRPDLLALAIVAVLGLVVCLRRRSTLSIAPIWLLAAILGVNIGGHFWPHYFVQVIPPLALMAALGTTAFRYRPPAVALTCFAIAPVAWSLGHYASFSVYRREHAISYVVGYHKDKAVARFVRAHTTRRDRVYALASRADLYFLADRRAAFPYLWRNSPLAEPRNMKKLRLLLRSPRRPRIVVQFQPPNSVDGSGRLAAALRANYRQIWLYRGTPNVPVLEARQSSPRTGPVRY